MSDLFWVRHAPTHQKCMVGWTDVPADLSDQDRLGRLNAFLPKDALVVSSDLLRARATADALESGRERLPHEPGLREIHFGHWEMKTFKEVEQTHPDEIFGFWDRPGETEAPGGESWNTLTARVDRATDALLARHPGRPLIIVAHFGAILTQVQRAMGLTAKEVFAHKIENLSVTHIRQQGFWKSERINFHP